MPCSADDFDFLVIDDFLKTFVDARVLGTALELGLVDHLQTQGAGTFASLARLIGCDRPALDTLIGLLRANRIVETQGDVIQLSERFDGALRYRDLLEAKLDFANATASDFFANFTCLLVDPGRFIREAQLFRMFDYSRCLQPSAENREWARRWMRFTTALTRYEAQACLRHFDFGPHRRILDIGGNSGEFVLRVCMQYPAIHATVWDLPVVCAIGREHIRNEAVADRITFLEGDARNDLFPGEFDLIVFKSFLHDWPEHHVKQFLVRSYQSLLPGGKIFIFERGPIQLGERPLPYSMIPMLLFFRSFRPPTLYRAGLEELGCVVDVLHLNLDTSFHLVIAEKPPSGRRPV